MNKQFFVKVPIRIKDKYKLNVVTYLSHDFLSGGAEKCIIFLNNSRK